ncbi:MAG: metallophosphoesterase family protein [Phenylobacterium sp.]|uniref:metallophosphoesterase family protein n=1 Tax=Phenylobacterium sp. TaxID=1871053 RepID=UPI00391D1AE7
MTGLRIAHLSDIHFGDENVEAVAAAAAQLRADPPDLTIISGDLTRFAEKDEFVAAAAWLESLPDPLLVTPGNHDAPYIAWAERIFRPFARYQRAIGPVWRQSHRAEGLAVEGVNTARGAQWRLNWSKGAIRAAQAQDACARLRQAEGLKVLVCHHPLIELPHGPMTGRVRGGRAAAQAFAEAGVDLVLTGHLHAPFALAYPFADGRTYAVGAGTLSVRERGVPAGFNMLNVERAAIEIAALAWNGSSFDPWRTWSLDRRRPRPRSDAAIAANGP